MTTEDLLAITIVITLIGVPCMVYWLYKTRGIKGWSNKSIEGPPLPQMGVFFMIAHYALLLFVLAIGAIKQLL